MSNRSGRRTLKFHDLDEVVAEAKRLLEKGYEPVGAWNLSQVCGHLAEWISYPIEGYPRLGCLAPVFWVMRATFGRRMGRRILATGTMPAGKPTLRETVPEPDSNPEEALKRLDEAVANFKSHRGHLHASPIFGTLTYEEHERLQLIHCAHHMSFLLPK